jgi:pyruvate/2-oxoglutarate dehydrogenase complex dihydrolipoamide acyltransferase (E2) component
MTHVVLAELVASVYKIVAQPGDVVAPGDTLVILESMKMEIPVLTELAGTVTEIAVAEGDVISEGDTIAVVEPLAPSPGSNTGRTSAGSAASGLGRPTSGSNRS